MSVVIDNLHNDVTRTPTTIPMYESPWWLQGAHAQTIYPPLFARRPPVNYTREEWRVDCLRMRALEPPG